MSFNIFAPENTPLLSFHFPKVESFTGKAVALPTVVSLQLHIFYTFQRTILDN